MNVASLRVPSVHLAAEMARLESWQVPADTRRGHTRMQNRARGQGEGAAEGRACAPTRVVGGLYSTPMSIVISIVILIVVIPPRYNGMIAMVVLC